MKIFYIIIFALVSCSNQKPARQSDNMCQTVSLQFRKDTVYRISTIFLDPEFAGVEVLYYSMWESITMYLRYNTL